MGGVTPAAPLPGPSRVATLGHVVPFVVWLVAMMALEKVFGPNPWFYAVRTVLCLGLLVALRPWRWYTPLQLKHLPLAVGVGIAVFAVWVLPEVRWTAEYPLVQELYLRFLVLPLGRLPEIDLTYAPEQCGWALALIRLAGSAFVIAIIEEFFWRGFLYRWLQDRNYLTVGLSHLDWEAVAMMCLLFGFEHHRWFAGILAGAAYLWLMLRTKDLWAAVYAHVVTNFLLGIYVLVFRAYAFW